MPTTITTLALRGTSALPVHAVCAIEPGMPLITVIGCQSSAEVGAIARCAIRSAGFEVPQSRVVVQLDPPEIAMTVSQASYALLVAVAVLVESRQVPPLPDDIIVHGSLSIDGSIGPMRGDRAVRLLAREQGFRTLATDDLASLRDPTFIAPATPVAPSVDDDATVDALCLLPTRLARLAAVTAIGSHDTLLVGHYAPLVDFSRAVTALMGPLDAHDATEVAVTHDACDLPAPTGRPVRFPHHSITLAGMVGGGRPVMPGEVTLADHGVLALEDVPEWSPRVLDAVRVAHEEGMSRIVRAEGITEMPAHFVLVASAAPCPCGHLGDPDHDCTCSLESIYAWRERMMGHLAFDILAEAPGLVDARELTSVVEAERLVESARLLRDARAAWSEDATCCMTETAREALDIATRNLRLTERTRRSVARVARSLAAIDGCNLAGEHHVTEALTLAPRG